MPIGRPPLQKLRSATKTNPSHQTSSIIAPGALGRMRPYAEIQRIDFAVTVALVGQSGRHPIPQPRRPDRKSLQAEATT